MSGHRLAHLSFSHVLSSEVASFNFTFLDGGNVSTQNSGRSLFHSNYYYSRKLRTSPAITSTGSPTRSRTPPTNTWFVFIFVWVRNSYNFILSLGFCGAWYRFRVRSGMRDHHRPHYLKATSSPPPSPSLVTSNSPQMVFGGFLLYCYKC